MNWFHFYKAVRDHRRQLRDLDAESNPRVSRLEALWLALDGGNASTQLHARREYVKYLHWAALKRFVQFRAYHAKMSEFPPNRWTKAQLVYAENEMQRSQMGIMLARVEAQSFNVSVVHIERKLNYLGD